MGDPGLYDIDNDGFKDVIMNNCNLSNMPNTPGSNSDPFVRNKTMIIIWKNLGNGQFSNITDNIFGIGENVNIKPNGESYQKIRMFDIDGDGQNELVYENLNTTSLYFKLINGKFVRYYNPVGFVFNSIKYPSTLCEFNVTFEFTFCLSTYSSPNDSIINFLYSLLVGDDIL
jgi:hypothetical protein